MKVLISSVVAAVGLVFFLAGPAAAQKSADEAVDAALACRSIEDDAARLACLDKAADELSATRILRDVEDAETPELSPNEIFGFGAEDEKNKKEKKAKKEKEKKKSKVVETPEDFGGENLPARMKERDEARLTEITAKVIEIQLNSVGRATLILDNGHVWRQLDSDNRTIWLNKNNVYTVTIKKALLANYMLTVNELRRTIRVRRIQ